LLEPLRHDFIAPACQQFAKGSKLETVKLIRKLLKIAQCQRKQARGRPNTPPMFRVQRLLEILLQMDKRARCLNQGLVKTR